MFQLLWMRISGEVKWSVFVRFKRKIVSISRKVFKNSIMCILIEYYSQSNFLCSTFLLAWMACTTKNKILQPIKMLNNLNLSQKKHAQPVGRVVSYITCHYFQSFEQPHTQTSRPLLLVRTSTNMCGWLWMLAAGLMVECTQKRIKWMHLVRCVRWPKWLNLLSSAAQLVWMSVNSIGVLWFKTRSLLCMIWYGLLHSKLNFKSIGKHGEHSYNS